MANSQSIEEKFKSLEHAITNVLDSKECKYLGDALKNMMDNGPKTYATKDEVNYIKKWMSDVKEITQNNFNAVYRDLSRTKQRIGELDKVLCVVITGCAVYWMFSLASRMYCIMA